MERGNKVSTVLNYVSNFIEKYLTVPEIYASDIVEIVNVCSYLLCGLMV